LDATCGGQSLNCNGLYIHCILPQDAQIFLVVRDDRGISISFGHIQRGCLGATWAGGDLEPNFVHVSHIQHIYVGESTRRFDRADKKKKQQPM